MTNLTVDFFVLGACNNEEGTCQFFVQFLGERITTWLNLEVKGHGLNEDY